MKRAAIINTCGLSGLAMLGVGLWMVAPYLSLVVCGSVMLALSIAGALR